ncbi:ATP-binding cassette transporter yor1 [Metarhizium acridum]|nr:ATP-binding cassette transporter yor1 [Metarhizium acridum]
MNSAYYLNLFQPEVAIRAARHGGQRARLHRGHPGRDVAVQRQPLHRRPRAQLHPVHCAAAAVLHPAAAEVENGMNAVERLQHYGTQLEEEAPLHTVDVRSTWPEKGEIVFRDVRDAVPPGLPLVLRGLSMHVRGGGARRHRGPHRRRQELHHVDAVPARRGSRPAPSPSTASHLHRGPDPTLFRGTVRSNLDPFSEHADLALWSALRQAHLIPPDASLDDRKADPSPSRIHLDSVVEEDGLNFSLGQRQLMALARALVRGSQIIVCDEATSSVDMETDDKIQNTMATGFKGKTLLCIAHRLRTIIGYDRICVMDAGRIAEMDTPPRPSGTKPASLEACAIEAVSGRKISRAQRIVWPPWMQPEPSI